MSVGFYQSRPREEGLDIVFKVNFEHPFVLWSEKLGEKKKKDKAI